MEDLVSKTTELASLVSSLQQQGGDTSDLSSIVAQLEAAVARRSLQPAASQLLPVTKTEPTDSSGPQENLPVVSGEYIRVEVERLPQGSLRQLSAEQLDQQEVEKEPLYRKPQTKTVSKARPRRKARKKKNIEESVSDSGDDLNDDLANFILYEAKVASPISADIVADEEIDDDNEDYTPEELTKKRIQSLRGAGYSLAFSGSCKLCEVQKKLESQNVEGTLAHLTESALTGEDKLPVFNNLTIFANHLKKTHMFSIVGRTDLEVKETAAPRQDEGAQPTPDATELPENSTSPKAANSSTAPPAMFMACPLCEKRYNFHGTAKSCYDQCVSHMHRKHGEALPNHVTLYNCPDCHFQTLRKRDLSRHKYVVHTDHESRGEPRGVPCEICGKCVLPTSMIFHMAAVHGSDDVPAQVKARTAKVPCHVCGKEFRGEVNLQRHIKCVHSKIKEQLCHLCSQSFFAKRELQLHMFANHKINISNMKVFKCPVEGCTYETLARRHLHIHSSVHTVTKDFTCEHCGKAFKSKPALSQHLRIMHTKDVHYRCPKCTFTSHAKQYVQRHMVIHSDTKKHKCDFESCTYATHFIENLTKHKRKHRLGKE
ncbi:zinc finger and BTB domain-containing protein 41-like isoform X2 [Watersipora subatra]|uniref:zinc finger and BTB domain-containing protein 41-like isoform X2 n=1 Tax=Watersipora subatra TaxID=2589382 RepID=UPI00355B35D0